MNIHNIINPKGYFIFSHRVDLWKKQNYSDLLIDLSTKWKLIFLSRPILYLPRNSEFTNKIKIKIKGYASPLHNREYNQALSKRRITSLVNYLKQYNNVVFAKYIQSQDLIISELPFGESVSSEKVSDNPNDKKKSIYSIEAMHERKIEIVEVTLEK